MTSFHSKQKNALAAEDYEASILWGTAEDLVNAFQHGLHPTEWLPKFYAAVEGNAAKAESERERQLWLEAKDEATILWAVATS